MLAIVAALAIAPTNVIITTTTTTTTTTTVADAAAAAAAAANRPTRHWRTAAVEGRIEW
jgi:hypothetical protein